MNMVFNLIVLLQVISALAIIGLVLLQHGKGADMGAAFGSGASGSLFGASGSSNFLSKSTAVAAVVFFACTLALSYMGTQQRTVAPTGGGLMEQQKSQQIPAAPAAPAANPGQIPAAPAGTPNGPVVGTVVPAQTAANPPAGVTTAPTPAHQGNTIPK